MRIQILKIAGIVFFFFAMVYTSKTIEDCRKIEDSLILLERNPNSKSARRCIEKCTALAKFIKL